MSKILRFSCNKYIYSHRGNLNEEFVRIREYQKSNWDHKSIVVVHKIRDLTDGNHTALFKQEYDSLETTINVVSASFTKEFSFSRKGWEYALDNMHIHVEEIEGMPLSIEVVAPSRKDILDLFKALEVLELLEDSVPRYLQKKISL